MNEGQDKDKDKGKNVDTDVSLDFRNNEELKEFVLHQIRRAITNLYKSQLDTIVDLNQLYLHKLTKNKDKIPAAVYNDLAFWDIALMGQNRKRTLDGGNDTIRGIEELFDKVDLRFKK